MNAIEAIFHPCDIHTISRSIEFNLNQGGLSTDLRIIAEVLSDR